jgi:hypothetical protein
VEVSGDLGQLMLLRRLMQHAKRIEDKRNGKTVDEKSLLDELEDDQVLIGGSSPAEKCYTRRVGQVSDDVQVNLSELSARLKEINNQKTGGEVQAVQVEFQQVVERKACFTYTSLEKVDGLVRRSQSEAETDRYRFEFSDGTTLKITDKWTNRSTTIWGDPHVDVDDIDGSQDGDFQDLKGSDSQTTFKLLDGTRITFTARDSDIIQAVDIFKGSQHLGGIGAGSDRWGQKEDLFAATVDEGTGSLSAVPLGDVVFAGGDGNDWYTGDGKLLWGKTTGPSVSTRPTAVMQIMYQETISQSVSVQVIDKKS